jgi:hypothetical protein
MVRRPSASVAEIVVRTIRRGSCTGQGRPPWRCFTEQAASDTERGAHAAAESTKDGGKPDYATGMLGASLTAGRSGEGPV